MNDKDHLVGQLTRGAPLIIMILYTLARIVFILKDDLSKNIQYGLNCKSSQCSGSTGPRMRKKPWHRNREGEKGGGGREENW